LQLVIVFLITITITPFTKQID